MTRARRPCDNRAMMRLLLALPLAGLCACPSASSQALTVRARAAGAPVSDAMVGAACGDAARAAALTDATGTARLDLRAAEPVSSCDVVVAKEGFATADQGVDCRPDGCGPLDVSLEPVQ